MTKTLDVIYEEIYKLKNQNLSFKKFQKKFNFLGKISYKNISFNYANKSSLIENGSFIINKVTWLVSLETVVQAKILCWI